MDERARSRRRRRATCACALATIVLTSASVAADEIPSELVIVPPVTDRCTGETAERLAFIEQRLEDERRPAYRWWLGWTSGYALGMALTSAQAATEGDSGDRAVSIVSAVKATFGTTRLLIQRPNARLGADPLASTPTGDAEACARRLKHAEQLLERNAYEARRKFRWKAHAFNVALNSLGAVVAGEGWGSRGEAWISAGIGVFVGELQIWTLPPTQPAHDWDDYNQRFPASAPTASGPGMALSLVPMTNGAALRLTF